jgi:hypothetical protein
MQSSRGEYGRSSWLTVLCLYMCMQHTCACPCAPLLSLAMYMPCIIVREGHTSTYIIIDYMELSPSWEATNCAAIQEFPSVLWKAKIYYRVHWSLSWANVYHSNSIYQHFISLVIFLIYKGSLEGEISCCARRLMVCYAVTFLYKYYFYNRFRPYKIIIK